MLPEGDYACTLILDASTWECFIPALGVYSAGEMNPEDITEAEADPLFEHAQGTCRIVRLKSAR